MSKYVLTGNAVTKLKRALAYDYGNSPAPNAAPGSISIDDFPPPFTVRWSQQQASGSGAWVIWLPDPAKLVAVGGSYITPSNISAATGLPSGWYVMTTVSSSATAVYLNITTYTATGQVFADLSATPGQTATGYTVVPLLVATMVVDSTKGTRQTKQYIDSAVTFGGSGGGGSVALDDVSLDWNTGNEAQIKDWDTGTPASATTIAQDIAAGGGYGTLVERDSNGALAYKSCGTLAQLLGSTVTLSSQKILTGLSWSTSNHTLVISSATVTVANGVITSWTANADETIATTDISSILT